MDIFIKSFNRVYYLDRCLHSLSIYLKNFEGKIIILDDGTPQKYLDAILEKYSNVIINKSEHYEIKSKLLENQNYNLPQIIPSKLWFESVSNASDYFIILEDDMWFTSEIDCKQIEELCKQKNIALIKMLWIGNTKILGEEIIDSNVFFELYKPKIQYYNPTIFKLIFAKYNPIWRKILKAFNIYSKNKELGYYSIYSVAGAIFKKEYFIAIWKNSTDKIDEKMQLYNALQFIENETVKFAKSTTEKLKTGFISSAFEKKKFSEFSVHDFNFTLNENWLKNPEFFCKNFEFDLNKNEIKAILVTENKSDLYIEQWENWVLNFKESYRNIGCIV